MYTFDLYPNSKFQEVEVIQVILIGVDQLVGRLRKDLHNKEEGVLDH